MKKYLLILLLAFNFVSWSQTTLINPAGDGGFETGTTFAANNWNSNTPVSTTQTQWVVGTLGAAVNSGSRSAYVTKNRAGTPPPNTYNAATAAVSHMWYDASVPTNENTLSLQFNWKCVGDSFMSITYTDYFKVWIIPQTVTPVYGTAITSTGSYPGQDNILIGRFADGTSWNTFLINTLQGFGGKNVRIVFEWINNNSTAYDPPAAIDNVSLISSPTTSYCTAGSTGSNTNRRINNFTTIGGYTNINRTSTYDTGGYYDAFTNTTQYVEYFAGGSFGFSLLTHNTSGKYYANIYVDWNNDNDFYGPGEKVWSSGGLNYFPGGTPRTGSIIIPTGTALGDYRMRVVVENKSSAVDPLPCGILDEGEYEDYKIKVSPIPNCVEPNVTASTTSASSATANWTAPGFGTTPVGYEYVISTSNTTPVGSGTSTTLTTQSFTGLTPGTYYVFVRSNCGGGNFSTWDSTYFTLNSAYCSVSFGSSTGFITNFSTVGGITNITNPSGSSSYTDYSSIAVEQYAASSITYTLSLDAPDLYGVKIWVDWNKDFYFDNQTEAVFFNNTSNQYSVTGLINIPANTAPGDYRIRIVASSSVNPMACGSYTYYGEGEDYTLRVLSPPACSSAPSNVTFYTSSQTTGTLSWTAPATPPVNGYAYYLSTSNITPVFGATPTGTVSSTTTSVNITGLTGGTVYYVWVRSLCVTDGAWIGSLVFSTPVCPPGTGNGTTTLQCPTMVAGGAGLNGLDPTPITCNSAGTANLEAVFNDIKTTSNYTVQPITYAPPYQFNCLRNKLFIDSDDIYSPVLNLPFDFCFFGNSYNKCVVSSNGSITFDTSLALNYAGWEFNDNIPSQNLSLKANSIFGVYQDLNPKISGGEIGWELITLNNGCRALVVSYYNVAYYNADGKKYTGMMVLYENTNIIDVYIQNKEVNNWNDGNALIGIQNASATTAIVAPGKNTLDPNWTTTNEAWRFTPNGTSLSTINWYEGPTATGPVIGTGATISVSPSVSTTYTAEITYNLCNGQIYKIADQVFVEVKPSSQWNGSVSSDWNNTANWTPATLPTLTDCVLIPDTPNDPIISGSGYNALAGNVTIDANASLTINSGNNLTITDWINVNASGTCTVESSANLVQINNVANTGNIIVKRDANLRKLDYVYWSSPVANFASSAISPGTNPYYIWKWTPTISTNLNGYGNWASGNEAMTLAKGYIVRGPDNFTATPQIYTSTFTGVANNGDISLPITRGAYTGLNYSTPSGTATNNDDNWNLLGNPYPSSIRAIDFLNTNTNIAGFIKIWTHGTLPANTISDPFYDNFVYNYTSDDYITYNVTGVSEGPGIFNGFINSCQGFFTLMLDSGASTQNIVYNNSMRSATYANNQFFRVSNNATENLLPESRLWLDLISPSSKQSRALIGYVNNATNDSDRLYDAITDEKATFKLYSKIQNEKMTIQGRALPFDIYDKVPLGANINQIGEYVFSVGVLEGFLEESQYNIYIEDKLLQIEHNLKNAPYRFTIDNLNEVSIDNRFVLKYLNSTLSNEDFENNSDVIISSSDVINVYSSKETIQSVQIHNVLGQLLVDERNINSSNFEINKLLKNNAPLIIQVTLENGKKVNKKIIY